MDTDRREEVVKQAYQPAGTPSQQTPPTPTRVSENNQQTAPTPADRQQQAPQK